MYCQIFLSPQVQRCAIINYKHGIYKVASRVAERLSLLEGALPTQEQIEDLGSLEIRKYEGTV